MKKTKLLLIITAVFLLSGCSLPFVSSNSNSNHNINLNENISVDTNQEATLGIIGMGSTLIRDSGEGNCGIAPWNNNCTTYKVWWGLNLKIAISGYVLIIPDGENRWVISNNSDVVSKYPQYQKFFNLKNNGQFTKTVLDFGQFSSDCDGSLTADPFSTQIIGVRVYDNLKLIFSSQAKEKLSGACGTTNFNYETTHMNYGIAAALSGNPEDMTAIMGPEDLNAAGSYVHKYTIDTNPSPQNRDHVTANIWFTCTEVIDNTENQVQCPWYKEPAV